MKTLLLWYFLASVTGGPQDGQVITLGPYPTKATCLMARKDTISSMENAWAKSETAITCPCYWLEKDCFSVKGDTK